jgi:hypothetical protein
VTNEPKAEAPAVNAQPSDQAPAAGAEKPAKGEAATAKPSAPVSVTASIRPGAADLAVVFGSDGSAVTIKVWGVDGLKVTSGATPTTAASVKSGQTMKLAVQYTAPTTESNLAISVSGTFAGQEQNKTQSFTINPGSPPAKAPAGESTTDKDGRRVKVIKAQ